MKSYLDALNVQSNDKSQNLATDVDLGVDESNETIEYVKEVKEFKSKYKGDFYSYEGYEIRTTRQQIHVLIESGQLCCEEYGSKIELPQWMTSLDQLVGAKLIRVYWGKDLKPFTTTQYGGDWNACCIIVDTNKGRIKIILYNYHNGYYPHRYRVSWKNYESEDTL